jgi:hypothetical protein
MFRLSQVGPAEAGDGVFFASVIVCPQHCRHCLMSEGSHVGEVEQVSTRSAAERAPLLPSLRSSVGAFICRDKADNIKKLTPVVRPF